MEYLPNFCPVNVKWDDVLRQINEEMLISEHRTIASSEYLCRPTIITHTNNHNGSVKDTYHKLVERVNSTPFMHLYVSFSQQSSTLGRHRDEDNVLIVQAIGSVAYGFDSGEFFVLHPGDAIFIPKMEYHTPEVVIGPRVTLSFSDTQSNLTLKRNHE